MITEKFKINGIIIFSSIIALLIIVLLFSSVSFPLPIHRKITNAKSFVSFNNLNESNSEEILKAQAIIFDTKPIFLPSEWNDNQFKSNEAEEKSLFQDLPVQISLYNHSLLSKIIDPEFSTVFAEDILNKKIINPFEGINQIYPSFSSLNIPKIHVVIKDFNHSKIIESYEIDSNNLKLQKEFWTPLEFLVAIDESGPIIPLFIAQSSGIEEVDNFLKNYIIDPLLKLSHLPEGYYRVSINP